MKIQQHDQPYKSTAGITVDLMYSDAEDFLCGVDKHMIKLLIRIQAWPLAFEPCLKDMFNTL